MNQGRTVFTQLISLAPHQAFARCVERYKGNARLRRFSCWDQFLVMAFAQLTYRESLRDIAACLGAIPERLYHMGIRSRVSRSGDSAVLEELAHGEANVPRDAAQQDGRDVAPRMKGDGGRAPVRMAKLLVRPLLAHHFESEPLKNRGNLPRLQNRDVSHVRRRS